MNCVDAACIFYQNDFQLYHLSTSGCLLSLFVLGDPERSAASSMKSSLRKALKNEEYVSKNK